MKTHTNTLTFESCKVTKSAISTQQMLWPLWNCKLKLIVFGHQQNCVKIHVKMTHMSSKCVGHIYRECLLLRLVHAHLCTDLHENFIGVQLLYCYIRILFLSPNLLISIFFIQSFKGWKMHFLFFCVLLSTPKDPYIDVKITATTA